MPRYNTDPGDHILDEREVIKCYLACATGYERMLICLLWLTGARPSELLELTNSSDCIWWTDDILNIKLVTKKLGRGHTFKLKHRIGSYTRPRGKNGGNVFVEFVVKFFRTMREKRPADCKVFPYSMPWLQVVVKRVTLRALKLPLSSYHFRHSYFTNRARQGATAPQLMYEKGSSNMASANPYLHAMPTLVRMEANGKEFFTMSSKTVGVHHLPDEIRNVMNRPAEPLKPKLIGRGAGCPSFMDTIGRLTKKVGENGEATVE